MGRDEGKPIGKGSTMNIVERDDLSLIEEIPYGVGAAASIKGIAADDPREWIKDVEWEHGWISSPEGGGSVDLVALGRHKEGLWVGIEAWSDYTGWGCQDGGDVYADPNRDNVVRMGLTKEGRARLGIDLDAEVSR